MKRPSSAGKTRGPGAGPAARKAVPSAPGTQTAPPAGGANNSFVPLFTVRFQHGYYDATGGECPDFKVVPTPDCAKLMTSLGMIFRDQGTGFCVFINQARVAAMIDYVSNHASDAAMGAGYWTWLSFLLVPTNPLFVGLTYLPIDTNPMQQNLHVSNLQTTTRKGELVFSNGTGKGQGAIYPVSGPAISVPVTPGYEAVLTNLSGAAACSAVTSSSTATTFGIAGLPFGLYTVAFLGSSGSPIPPPASYTGPLNYLYVPNAPISLCVLDLLLTQPSSGLGNPAAFPIPPLAGSTTPAGTTQPVDLALSFRARDTFWQYYVVSQSVRGDLSSDLQIAGKGATFQKTSAQLPNGDKAVLFTSSVALPLRQRSPYLFRLTGHRKGSNGSHDEISVNRLPAAAAGPVWPVPSGDALTGNSEIYVYV